jgi:hypothetical protein
MGGTNARASPKSATFNFPSADINIFCGFKSLYDQT